MTTYTCINCAVAFKDPDLQRDHYKTDWHRYNLKRKVAELAPVTCDQFNARLEKQKQAVQAGGDAARTGWYCVVCSKSFSTEKAHVNHLKSKKHLEAQRAFDKRSDINQDELIHNRMNRKLERDEAERQRQKDLEEEMENLADDEDIEEVDSDEWDEDEDEGVGGGGDPIPVTDCLLCGHHSSNVERNVMHMTTCSRGSFFLPDADYIVDLEGLIEYLGAKVGEGNICLWCNRAFRDTAAVRKHMADKGHFKILHDNTTLAEYADFYDYTTSYPEGCAPDAAMEGGGGEEEEEVDIDHLDDGGYQLVLPSGATIGHRSLMRYYRQGVPADRSVVVRSKMSSVLGHYRSYGWVSATSAADAKKKAADIKFMRKAQQKAWMRLGTRANKLQKYWRDPTLQWS